MLAHLAAVAHEKYEARDWQACARRVRAPFWTVDEDRALQEAYDQWRRVHGDTGACKKFAADYEQRIAGARSASAIWQHMYTCGMVRRRTARPPVAAPPLTKGVRVAVRLDDTWQPADVMHVCHDGSIHVRILDGGDDVHVPRAQLRTHIYKALPR